DAYDEEYDYDEDADLYEEICLEYHYGWNVDQDDFMGFDEKFFDECWDDLFGYDGVDDNYEDDVDLSEEEFEEEYYEDEYGEKKGKINAKSPNDTAGGINFLEPKNKNIVRYFIGTWEINEKRSTCTDKSGADLDLPIILRAYSYDDYLDFETSMSELVWSGIIYPDETFDFEIDFLDKYGKPSIDLVCTCAMYEYYWNDTLECTCDPSHREHSCSLQYEMF
ncbi:hypothetical protein KJ708_05115, partial [bacterium]|nr:hypothetical protein [bacterium]MBU1918314.1 hypothetical protein [bacterium]